MNDKKEIVLKYILVGESGVGKSSICEKYTTGIYNKNGIAQTIGIEFYTSCCKIKESNVTIHIWDTAGQERFRSVTRNYYKDAIVAFIIFDLSDKNTLKIQYWIEDILKYSNKNIRIILVGNKLDMCNIPKNDIELLKNNYSYPYYEISAKNDTSKIDNMFSEITKNICNDITSNKLSISKDFRGIVEKNTIQQKSKCCN